MSETCWPTRSITLPAPGRMQGSPWLDDAQVAQVLAVFNAKPKSVLDKPVILENTVRLLALVPLGRDGIGGPELLYLRVTNEFAHRETYLRLSIIHYPQRGPSNTFRALLPGEVGDMLDGFEQQIMTALSLSSEERLKG